MSQQSLKQKATTSMAWTAFSKYSNMAIQFVSGIILARLLTPYDYGCIGLLNIFMVLAEAFIDGGFGSALIQKKQPTQDDYSTIFFWNLIMAAFMYAILYISAPAIARFYDIPLLCSVLRVQALVLFVYAFNTVQTNQLRKTLNFKTISIVSVITSLLAIGVTIYLAYNGFGVWSLVTQNMIVATIPAIVYWIFIKWRPSWTFSWKSFKELFSFGFYMFLTHLLNSFSTQVQGLLIGKVYNPSTMGYYSKAHSTEKLASTSISSIMTQVTYPLYAQVQDDKNALINMVRRLTITLSYITFPLMFILLLTAKPLFVLLYSDKWLQSVPYFQVLCIAGLAVCLQSVNLQTISAIGKSKVMLQWVLVKRAIGLSAIIGGLFFGGMTGLLCGVVFNSWFSLFINMFLVSRYIGYKWSCQLANLLPTLVVSVISAVISYFSVSFMHLNMYVDAIMKTIVYLIVYLGWSFIFKPEAFMYSKSIIEPYLSKISLGKKNTIV